MWRTSIRARRGYTLIELLTVAGIALVLATLIVTAVFVAEEAGRGAWCRSNLAQLHKLTMIYTQQYGQYLPAFWHERWVGEMQLAGGHWRSDLSKLQQKIVAKNPSDNIYTRWAAYLSTRLGTTKTILEPAPSGDANWKQILKYVTYYYVPDASNGYWKIQNVDDVNPLVPLCWNNYQAVAGYIGTVAYTGWSTLALNDEGRVLLRSGAPFIVCPSDTSAFRCDQGAMVSYMGLAKYGWWHRGNTAATARSYEYHQLQEVEKPSRGILFVETEPGTWQYGGCG